MSKSESLGYGYLYHFNTYTKSWECAHRDHAVHLFGTGKVNRSAFVATGASPDAAAANYAKKFGKTID